MADDTNIFGAIVKILEIPEELSYSNNILVTRFRVQFPQYKDTSIVYLTIWGQLATDVAKFYTINDYILIEGYISIRNNSTIRKLSKSKKVEITVLKIYPLVLS